MRQKKIRLLEGSSELGGYNVGKYPLHHYAYDKGVYSQAGLPLKLLAVGDDDWIKGCYRYRINSNVFSLEFVRKGSMNFVQNGKTYNVKADELFIIQFGSNIEMSTGPEIYCMKKTMNISGSLLPGLLSVSGLDKIDFIKPSRPEFLAGLFDDAYNECKSGKRDAFQNSSAIAYRVLVELAKDISAGNYPDKLNKALEFMENSLGRNISLSDICRKTLSSPATLNRLFKKFFDKSPVDYFIQKKIEAAKNLLSISQLSIKEISQQLGYSNQLYFSAEFRKRTGFSPKKYRNSIV